MTDSTAVQALLSGLSTNRDWRDFCRDLHAHPQLSHQEYETAQKVASRLCGRGYDVHDRIGGTGVIGVLRNGPGATVLLRADMDALPAKEATGDYASTVQTTDDDGNVIPDRAELQLNIRTYSRQTRTTMLDAIRRIVTAECQPPDHPEKPGFEVSTNTR